MVVFASFSLVFAIFLELLEGCDMGRERLGLVGFEIVLGLFYYRSFLLSDSNEFVVGDSHIP